MKRKALLVCDQAGSVGDGPRVLFRALGAFLGSDLGGAWRVDEVRELIAPSPDEVSSAVDDARGSDFFFGYFATTGERKRVARPWPQLVAVVGGKEFTEDQMNPGSPWCALVLDAAPWGRFRPSGIPNFAPTSKIASSRNAFETAIKRAEKGLVKVFVDSDCTVSSAGYTGELLQRIVSWGASERGVYTIDRAFSAPAIYEGGRRLHHFPIAVHEP